MVASQRVHWSSKTRAWLTPFAALLMMIGGLTLAAAPATASGTNPSGTDNTINAIQEGEEYTFSLADFGYSSPVGNNFDTVKLTTSPSAGTLYLSGVAVGAGDFISVTEIIASHFTFTPEPDGNGFPYSSFTFQVQDDGAAPNNIDLTPNTMTFNLLATNDAPVASDLTATTAEDTPVSLTGTATDVDGDALTYAVLSTPANGTLSGTAPNLTYTPDANFNGTDTFTFRANDGALNSNTATITITVTPVNDAPTGSVTIGGTPTTGQTLTANTATIADADGIPDANADGLPDFAYQWKRNGVSIPGATASTYLLSATDAGTSVTVTVSYLDNSGNGAALTSAATGPIASANDAPVASDLTATTAEDTPVSLTGTATDVDGDALTYAVLSTPANGTLSGTAPNLTYTPDANFNGTDTFTFRANDGALNSNTATITITVTPVNDAPTGSVTIGGTPTTGQTLTANTATIADADGIPDANADGLPDFAYQWKRNGVSIPGATASTYLLSATDAGTSVTVTVSYLDNSGNGAALTSAATGPIASANNAPIITSDGGGSSATLSVVEGSVAVSTVTSSDADGDAIAYAVVGGADAAKFAINPTTGALAFLTPPSAATPLDANADNVYQVVVQASDGLGGTDNQSLSITVTAMTPSETTPPANGGPAKAPQVPVHCGKILQKPRGGVVVILPKLCKTNAGRTVKAKVTCSPCERVNTANGGLRVMVVTTRSTDVNVQLRARATSTHSAYLVNKTYKMTGKLLQAPINCGDTLQAPGGEGAIILPRRCATNAGNNVKVRVICRGCKKVATGTGGIAVIVPKPRTVTVIVRLSAPATKTYFAYSAERKYRLVGTQRIARNG